MKFMNSYATKNRLSYFLVFISILFLTGEISARKRKVLFIGNSYVATNNLPLMIAQVATSLGDTLDYDSNTPGGFTLANHFANPTTKAKIALGGWDLVIIQAQSQEPAFSDGQVSTQTLPYAFKLDSLVNRMDSCTETQFYLTWGRKNGDASNCAFYPPICTYSGMQDKLTERYLRMSEIAKGSVAPVGEVWRKFRSAHPGIELYNPDESHPIVSGTYLAALVFYQSIFRKEINGAVYKPSSIADTTASFIKTISGQIMRDSAANWFRQGRLASAGFETTVSNGQASFQNTSFAANQFFWNFGDGNTSIEASPTHSYASTGNYSVKLTSKNGCKTDSIRKSVTINFVSTLSLFSSEELEVFPNPFSDAINVVSKDEIRTISLYDLSGKRLISGDKRTQMITKGIPNGVYLLQIHFKNGQVEQKRILKN